MKTKYLDHLTAGKAARHCRVTIPTIRRWIQDGRLVAFKTLGRHCRIDLEDFRRFLRQHGLPPYPVFSTETRILVVDDEALIVEGLVEFLSADPRRFKLETATDGYEALIKVGSFKPSILILDVLMPRLDGVELCQRLKADPETRAIKILGITAYLDKIPELLKAGADACLSKPLNLGKLQQELDRLLSARGGEEAGKDGSIAAVYGQAGVRLARATPAKP